MESTKIAIKLTLILILLHSAGCWDTEELELFDVVEEVNTNFYELLGVDQSASGADIRRAYRKLSVKLHPDKNKDEGAEEQFRKLVAVYEVLKDERKRTRYNEILISGLPDWRMPVYYYRRVRKLGLLELSIVLLIISTVGHFLVIWSVYLEKKFVTEELFKSRKRKDKKGRKLKHQEESETVDEALQEELDAIPRPKLTDLVPCKLVRGVVTIVTSVPQWVQSAKEWREERKRLKEIAEEEESEDEVEEEKVKKPKRRQRVDIPEYSSDVAVEMAPVIYLTEVCEPLVEEKREGKSGQDWSDDDLSLLAKASAKFPSGTVQRWEKIASMVDRSIMEVTAKSKEIMNTVIMSVDTASQGLTGSLDETVSFKKGQVLTSDISQRYSWNGVEPDSNASLKKNVPPSKTLKPATGHSKGTDLGAKTIVSKGTEPEAKKSISTGTEPEAKKSVAKETEAISHPKVSTVSALKDKKILAKGGASEVTPEEKNTLMVRTESDQESLTWTQNQQKALEWALARYPRGTLDRWDKVADHITGKNKDECIARFKHLAELIKRKKDAVAKGDKQ